ncbi:hypothetical protein GF322_00825 [Candidatus Dependentiae bacterium]|nr:hypothetical protein [Candidatus Dependentiae bacterium]
MNKNGSSVLIVLMITTFLSMLVFGYWYKSSLLLDLVNQREKFYKNFYLTEKILKYGIQTVGDNFDKFINTDIKFPLILDASFMIENIPMLQAEVLINKIDLEPTILISAFLKNKKIILCKLSCKLSKTEIFNDKTKNKEYYSFIQNFTINNFI